MGGGGATGTSEELQPLACCQPECADNESIDNRRRGYWNCTLVLTGELNWMSVLVRLQSRLDTSAGGVRGPMYSVTIVSLWNYARAGQMIQSQVQNES